MIHLKTYLCYALIGIGIGNLIPLLVATISHNDYQVGTTEFLAQFDSLNQAVLVQFSLYALLGLLQGLTSKLLAKESNSLLKQFLLHYAFIIFPLVCVGAYLQWFRLTLADFFNFLLCASIVYLIIGGIAYYHQKQIITKINQTLKQRP